MIRLGWASVANTVITTVQDLLGLGHEARMNTPEHGRRAELVLAPVARRSDRGRGAQLLEMTAIYGRRP